jgi:hypothetical protein
MSAQSAYLGRLTVRLGELDAQLSSLRAGADAAVAERLGDLEARLAVARERLQAARRAGAELTDEMLRSAGEGVERLAGRIAELMAQR